MNAVKKETSETVDAKKPGIVTQVVRAIFFGFGGICVCFGIYSVATHGFKSLAALVNSLESPDIRIVKTGSFNACPRLTVEQGVNSFLGSPKWESGVSDKGVHFVNITGDFTYYDKPVKGTIQFVVNDNSFEYSAFEINNVPQPMLMGIALISKFCNNKDE